MLIFIEMKERDNRQTYNYYPVSTSVGPVDITNNYLLLLLEKVSYRFPLKRNSGIKSRNNIY